jgi:(R,R)-butanediol dehydrogenase / meso-butanediol dehydrogenase / diacetyl reductase
VRWWPSGRQAGERGWRVGATVGVLPIVSCGTCRWCTAGHVAHCTEVRFIGMGPDGGGFAELAVVPARHAFELPRQASRALAPLVEPFAVGLHGVATAQVGAGEDVLVIGAGGVGLTTVAWAKAKGAARITVADPEPGRRATALVTGATDVLDEAASAEPGGYDVAIECVGRPELAEVAAAAVRALGRVVIAGAGLDPSPSSRLPGC